MTLEGCFASRVCQLLHLEHEATLDLTERLLSLVSRCPREPPDGSDRLTARLLRETAQVLEGDLARHFDFEEQQLFGRLDTGDARALAQELRLEHQTMAPQLHELARRARTGIGGFDGASWQAFRAVALPLCALLAAHVQKEETGLLPVVGESLGAESDAALADAYTGSSTGTM